MQESGYPDYRRRDDGTTAFTRMVNGKEVRIDNCWVYHSPYLTSRYINVEICASIHAIKYISKYIYKGPDRTTLRLDSNDDEVNHTYSVDTARQRSVGGYLNFGSMRSIQMSCGFRSIFRGNIHTALRGRRQLNSG